MRKKLLLAFTFLSLRFFCFSQLNDNTWLIGYHYGGFSPVPALDFYFGFPDTVGIFAPFDFFGTDASICDDAGNLQFYTNGVGVANYYNQLIPGSTNFNSTGGVISLYSLTYLNVLQGAIILPYPGHPGQYVIFHEEGNIFNNNQELQPMDLLYSIVDMNMNGGQGQMTSVNQVAIHDTMLYSTLQAVKHANGRDWWITSHKYNSDILYSVLFTPAGVSQVNSDTTGTLITKGFQGQSVFSPDGSKYAIAYHDSNDVLYFDFDRCAGIFSYVAKGTTPTLGQGAKVYGCSFSPNSQFIYASNSLRLYQFDTWAANFGGSRKFIAEWDGFSDPFGNYIYRHRLAPDNKIYINCGNGTEYLHTINQPDLPDTNCNFVQHQLKIINYQSAFPEFPNYRLGALTGSICDSLTAVNELMNAENNIRIYPNPAVDFLILSGLGEMPGGIFELADINGRTVIEKSSQDLKTNSTINISSLSRGLYYYSVSAGDHVIGRGKILKIMSGRE